ncbi:hypothetical protein GCM10010246_00540 [Streptomyces cuspidosporus]|uniref:Uncharacterized protein n=1 Tax=Streptomyces cuspidosporus TaxID=66882 RepID=A0ABN3F8R4_9ACTN
MFQPGFCGVDMTTNPISDTVRRSRRTEVTRFRRPGIAGTPSAPPTAAPPNVVRHLEDGHRCVFHEIYDNGPGDGAGGCWQVPAGDGGCWRAVRDLLGAG